jgi:serine O-acetyltransferase
VSSRAAQTLLRGRRDRHPPFIAAVLEDARITAAYRAERSAFRSRRDATIQALRLLWVSDAFLGQVLYRAKARLQALGVPVVPRVLHRLAIMTAQVCIGDPVIVSPGLYLPHGQVVIDGLTELGSGTIVFPFVTIGLKAGNFTGPTIGAGATIGTGAKVIGPVVVGAGARIGANAVVVHDVPAGATVVGVPAHVI